MITLKANPEWQKGQKGMDRKKRMTARKAAAWLLILAAVTVMAAGCGPKPGGAALPKAGNGETSDNSDVPRGRYVERELTFPFDPSTEMMEAMMLSPEGDILVLTYNLEMEERVAINRNGRQKETAERFVAFLLSEQIQGEDVKDGFPVTRAGVERWKQRQIMMSYGTGSQDGLMIYGDYPTESERKLLLDMIPNLDHPVVPDPTVLSIMAEESEGYFNGAQDIPAAVKAITGKVTLYRAETE